MKVRGGFVSNSSSSSFIIDFGKPVTKRRDVKFKSREFENGEFTEKDLEHLFYWMIRSKEAKTLNEYLSLDLRCKKLDEKLDMDEVLERLKLMPYVDDIAKETLRKVAGWEHPEYSRIFEIGSDSDFNMFSFESPLWEKDHMVSNWAQRNFDQWKDIVGNADYL